jgi:hypothetical protein
MMEVGLFLRGVIGNPGIAFSLRHRFLVGLLGEGFGLLLDEFYDVGVSGERGVIQTYDGLHYLVHHLLVL